jgi:hypothetical protein
MRAVAPNHARKEMRAGTPDRAGRGQVRRRSAAIRSGFGSFLGRRWWPPILRGKCMKQACRHAAAVFALLCCGCACAAPYPTEGQLRAAIENAAKLVKAEGLDLEALDAQKVGLTRPLLAARLSLESGTCLVFFNTKPEDGLTQYFETIAANNLPVLLNSIAMHEATHCIEQREAYVRQRFDKILPPGYRNDAATVQDYRGAVESGALETWGEALADIASLLYLKQATPEQWLELAMGVARMRHGLARKWPEHDTSPWLYKLIAADAGTTGQSLFETAFQLRRQYRPGG